MTIDLAFMSTWDTTPVTDFVSLWLGPGVATARVPTQPDATAHHAATILVRIRSSFRFGGRTMRYRNGKPQQAPCLRGWDGKEARLLHQARRGLSGLYRRGPLERR